MLYKSAKKYLERFVKLRYWLIKLNMLFFAWHIQYIIHIQGKQPVLIYQMGKVGSTSVYKAFPTANYPIAVHLHVLVVKEINRVIEGGKRRNHPTRRAYFQGEVIINHVIKPKHQFKVITLVREPVSRSISNFFQKLDQVLGVPFEQSTHTTDELIDLYLEREFTLFHINWFDKEFRNALGINVYEHPFPHDTGYLRIKHDNADILLMRLELDDTVKEQVIADFLGEDKFSLARANVGKEKVYADTYREFKEKLVIPIEHLDKILNAEYSRHFYSEEEREIVRDKWLRRIAQSQDV